MGLADQVAEYFRALIIGVLLLAVLWQVVLAVAKDIPQMYQVGIAIAIAAGAALLILAKSGIGK